MPPKPTRIRCSDVNYRQGFIEVSAWVHENKISVETWQLDPETVLENCDWVDDPTITDDDITANCELEMSIDEAKVLANSILAIIGDRPRVDADTI